MKDKELIILLLQLIKFNGNIKYLIINGCEHRTLINTLKVFEKEKITAMVENKLSLTAVGETYLKLLNKELKRKGLYKYVSSSLENRCEKMKLEEIYIPLHSVKEEELFSLSHSNVKIDESSIDNELSFKPGSKI